MDIMPFGETVTAPFDTVIGPSPNRVTNHVIVFSVLSYVVGIFRIVLFIATRVVVFESIAGVLNILDIGAYWAFHYS